MVAEIVQPESKFATSSGKVEGDCYAQLFFAQLSREGLYAAILHSPRGADGTLTFGEHVLHAAQRLPCTLFILDQREANMAVAIIAKTNAGRNHDIGFI